MDIIGNLGTFAPVPRYPLPFPVRGAQPARPFRFVRPRGSSSPAAAAPAPVRGAAAAPQQPPQQPPRGLRWFFGRTAQIRTY